MGANNEKNEQIGNKVTWGKVPENGVSEGRIEVSDGFCGEVRLYNFKED